MRLQIKQLAQTIQAGGVIAAPTEAVWGFSCDPLNLAAVQRLLSLKQRPLDKGLILAAADPGQLSAWVEGDIPEAVLATWPGPVTWLLPVNPAVPVWVTGGRDKIAVRVTAHGPMAALCSAAGTPLISTSANRSGCEAIRSLVKLRFQFGQAVDGILTAALGGSDGPSTIRDAATGNVIRA